MDSSGGGDRCGRTGDFLQAQEEEQASDGHLRANVGGYKTRPYAIRASGFQLSFGF
jgi:hypothetical protein